MKLTVYNYMVCDVYCDVFGSIEYKNDENQISTAIVVGNRENVWNENRKNQASATEEEKR